jgi:hypothetical protein
MSNNETFMAVAIIYSLQKFHIHYGMDVVGKEAWGSFVVVFFFLILQDFLIQKEDYERLFNKIFQPLFFLFCRAYFRLNKGKNFSIQDNIFQARKED